MRVLDNMWFFQEPFQLGVFILDKLIGDIKAKLPSKKKAVDENDGDDLGQDATDPTLNLSDETSSTDVHDIEDEEVEATKSIVDKLKAKFAPKKKAAAADDDDDEDVKKKPEKKKINPVILVVVLGGLGFFLFYEEEPEVAPVAEVKPAYKIQKVPKEKPAEVAVETPATEAPVVDTPAAETPVTDTPVAEAPVETAPAETAPVDEPVLEPVDPVIDEPVVTDIPVTPDPTIIAPESVDSVDGQVATDDSSVTDKILEDLEKQVKKDQPKEVKKEYVAPPDYEYKGRGLVYNCAGKHWACVDAPSYKTCEDNFSSVTFKKKTVECYPFNVYDNTRGCESMQNRVVSSNAKTGFCKGN